MAPPPQSNPCAHCGVELAPGASFCRECGSDEQTGWADPSEISDQAALAELPGVDETASTGQAAGAGSLGPGKLLVVAVMIAAIWFLATGGSRLGLQLAAAAAIVFLAMRVPLLARVGHAI